MACARIAEIMARDEHALLPLGCYTEDYGVTLSLPSVLGRKGVVRRVTPPMSPAESAALQRSADHIKAALEKTASG